MRRFHFFLLINVLKVIIQNLPLSNFITRKYRFCSQVREGVDGLHTGGLA